MVLTIGGTEAQITIRIMSRGLFNSHNGSLDFGGIEAHYDFLSPLNIIDSTGGYDSYTHVEDLSGHGRHLSVPSKAAAPRYSSTNGAGFLAAQYFNRLTSTGATVGTVLIITDGAQPHASGFRAVGTFNAPTTGVNTGFLAFGNSTGASALENVSYLSTGSGIQTFESVPITYGIFSMFTLHPGTKRMSLNGTGYFTSQGTAYKGTLDMQIGLRLGSAQYFTGNIKKIIIFKEDIENYRLMELYNIYK